MGSEQARDRLAAALVELTEHGIPADVQELLVGGNPDRRVRLGALSRVLTTAREQALREAAEVFGPLMRRLELKFGYRDAPGHSHDKEGVWDLDNEPDKAGTPCSYCATWRRARDFLSVIKEPTQ